MRILFIAAAAAAIAAAPAQSETFDDGAPTARISVADLNLATPAGQRSLHFRVSGAIERMCGSASIATNLRESAAIDACRKTASADADRQLAALAQPTRLADIRR